MARLKIYGDLRSGNCLKVKWTAERLGVAYDWVAVDIFAGGARTPEFLAINPAAEIPTVILEDGRPLAQSGAILIALAEGSDLITADAYERARMLQWMFWEQYSHEPYIAVRRALKLFHNTPEAELAPKLMDRGLKALTLMEGALTRAPWLAGDALSLADIALYAYTSRADEGGFDLAAFPAVQAWVARVGAVLEPLTPSAP